MLRFKGRLTLIPASRTVNNLHHHLLPLIAIWPFPVLDVRGLRSHTVRGHVSICLMVPQSSCVWALHSQRVAGTHSHAAWEWGASIHSNSMVWHSLPSVHQAQLAFIQSPPVHLLVRA